MQGIRRQGDFVGLKEVVNKNEVSQEWWLSPASGKERLRNSRPS